MTNNSPDNTSMTMIFRLHLFLDRLLIFGAIAFAATATACGDASTAETEDVESIEWNVAVCRAVQFNDSPRGISTDRSYTVGDTASVNERLMGVKPENLTFEWTVPAADGTIWLVAFESEPILSEKVRVTENNSIFSYGGNIQVAFKFSDVDRWATITRRNIGKRLAIFVNGRLMGAPQVNTPIESGSCSVTFPAEAMDDYLPNFDLENIGE